MSLEDLAFIVRLLKKDLEHFTAEELAEGGTHHYILKTYRYYVEVYDDSAPDDRNVKEF